MNPKQGSWIPVALAGLKTPVQSLHRDSPNLKTDSLIGTIVFVASIFCTDIFITVPEKIFKSPWWKCKFFPDWKPHYNILCLSGCRVQQCMWGHWVFDLLTPRPHSRFWIWRCFFTKNHRTVAFCFGKIKGSEFNSLDTTRLCLRGNRNDFNAQGFWNLLVVPRSYTCGMWLRGTPDGFAIQSIAKPTRSPSMPAGTRCVG